jgi:hypothetical protein
MESSGWSAVRCVFRFDLDGDQTYEERVTLWRTGDLDAAVARAETEARLYADQAGGTWTGLAQGYLLSDPVEDGAEVFSLMRNSSLAPEVYLDRYFDTGSERQRHR